MPRALVLTFFGAILSAGCNNGSSVVSPSLPPQVIAVSGSNVLPINVNLGPTGEADNFAYATVTVCVPGTSTCQTIGDIQIDTGSSGLRILASALSPSLSLPQQTDPSGNPVVECLQFVSSYSWGPVQTADIQIAGEQAQNVAIQVIGSPAFPAVPDGCSSTGPSADTVQSFGANGLLGVGVFRQDCGSPCVFPGSTNPNFYYTCPASGCQPYAASLAQQVPNPVWLFSSTDNNGVIVELPTVAAAGATTVGGSLVFGIGTQSNNALGTATSIPADANGLFTTVYHGNAYSGSIFDTGSDALYFLDSGTTGLALCSDLPFYYCPTSTQNQSAAITSVSGTADTVNFSVANADVLFANPALSAFGNLGGPNPGTFDWGLPFFYGRNVFVAIEDQATPACLGPCWAF
jgi:hypothetical protein